MDAFIVVNHEGHGLVVRTSDWVVIADCSSTTFANQVAAAMNAAA